MDYLQLAASFEEQQDYDNLHIVNVPNEVINQWQDWVSTDPNDDPDRYPAPVYSAKEAEAMKKFQLVWVRAANAYPDATYPDLSEVQKLPEWTALRAEALAALAIFRVRGRMPQDYEVEPPPE